jgi:hypothetical protein
MPVRYGRFEMPKTLVKEESSATDTYAKFVAEPFEAGYGHTVGNSLRRVLLSSLEGAAITAVKITGAQHEFATLPGVVEDVTDIVLNLKRIKFQAADHEARKLSLSVNKEGDVTAGDIQVVQGYEVLNPKQLICTLDKKQKFEAELEVKIGRGFCPAEENKKPEQAIGIIAIDSLFSPVTKAAADFDLELHLEFLLLVERANVLGGIDQLDVLVELDVGGGDFAVFVGREQEDLRIAGVGLEEDFLEIQDDVGDVLNDTFDGGKFVHRAINFDGRDGSAFQGGQEHAAEGVADGVAVTGFKGFGDELSVGFCGG